MKCSISRENCVPHLYMHKIHRKPSTDDSDRIRKGFHPQTFQALRYLLPFTTLSFSLCLKCAQHYRCTIAFPIFHCYYSKCVLILQVYCLLHFSLLLVQVCSILQVMVGSRLWCPQAPNRNGKSYETDTLLGRALRTTSVPQARNKPSVSPLHCV